MIASSHRPITSLPFGLPGDGLLPFTGREVFTHRLCGARADQGVAPAVVSVQHDEQRSDRAIDAPRELGSEIRGEARR